MKKTLTLVLLMSLAWNTSYAQELYNLWNEAFKHINLYEYKEEETIIQETQETIFKPYSRSEEEYRKLAEVLASNFDFKRQNDTLLFVIWYTKGFAKPMGIYAQSTTDKKNFNIEVEWPIPRNFMGKILLKWGYKVRSYNLVARAFYRWEYRLIPSVSMLGYFDRWGPLLYTADEKGFMDIYLRLIMKGTVLGGCYYEALRIVLKNGKIVAPSYLWRLSGNFEMNYNK